MKRSHYKKSNARKLIEQNGDLLVRYGIVLLVIVAIIVGACLITRHRTTVRLEKEFEVRLENMRAETEEVVTAQMREAYGADLKDEQEMALREEGNAIAKVLYAYRWNTDDGLRSAVWCILNRVDSQLYPNTVEDVCSQKSQWMGWSEDNPIVQHLWEVAVTELKTWHRGVHAVDSGYVFLEWTPDEITLRDTFEGGRGCHYWYEGDWS